MYEINMYPAWYLSSDLCSSQKVIDVEELYQKTGIEYIKISNEREAEQLKTKRGYMYEDELNWSDTTPGFEEKMNVFRIEHLHTDEEIRYFIDGSGYFDVRDKEDRWVRIAVGAGVLIIVPPGVYHRFSFGDNAVKKFIRVRRFFSSEPVWKAYNRPSK